MNPLKIKWLFPFLVIGLVHAATSGAQTTPEALYSPGWRPDVIILIEPLGAQNYQVVAASPHNNQTAILFQAVKSLSQKDLQVSRIRSKILSGPQGGRDSIVQFFVSGYLVVDGGIWIEPFIRAFNQFKRQEISFLIGNYPQFNGLRQFSNPDIIIGLVQASGGVFRYRVQLGRAGVAIPSLPLLQPIIPTPLPPKPREDKAPLSSLYWILAAGLIAGSAGYIITRRLSILRGTTDDGARTNATQRLDHSGRR